MFTARTEQHQLILWLMALAAVPWPSLPPPGLCDAGTRGSCPERGKDQGQGLQQLLLPPSALARAMSIAHNLISTLLLPRDGTTIPLSHSQPSPVVLTGLERPASTNPGWGRSQD